MNSFSDSPSAAGRTGVAGAADLGRRALAVGALAVLLALPAPRAAAQAKAPPMTLTVATFPDLDRAARVALPAFKKLHPNVEVRITSLAIADHHTAMTAALATSANLPDVMAIDIDYVGRFAESGGLTDLATRFHALQHRAKLSAFAWSAPMSSKGALAGMPVDIGPGALFYRADLLAKAGVTEADLTRDWDSYLAAGRRLKASTGAYLLTSATDLKDLVIRSGLKDGEGIYFDAAGTPLVTSPRFVRAFELARAVRQAGIDARLTAWTSEWSEGLRRDRVATQMMGSWLAGHLKNWIAPEARGLWRSAPLPGGTRASWGGSFYAIPKASPNAGIAWDFIRLLTLDKAQQIEAFRTLDAFPALLEAQADSFVDQPIEYLGGQKARQQWRTAAQGIPALRVDRYDGVANEIVNAELSKVLDGGKDIQAALADAKSAIDRRVRRR